MDYSALRFWLAVGQIIFNLVLAWGVWASNKHKATNGRIDGLETAIKKDISCHESRLQSLENDMKHLPSHKDITDLSEKLTSKIGELGEKVSSVQASMVGVQKGLDLLNEHHLSGGRPS